MKSLILGDYAKKAASFSAIAGAVALTLGSTSATPDPNRFVAKSSSLKPAPYAAAPVAPLVSEEVHVVQPEVAVVPVAVKGPVYRGGGGDILARIKMCESGGNYSTNTGNGYYGAYQYDRATWNNYGGYSTADQAPPEMQDEKARQDYARRGGSPWPTCSRR